MKSIGIVCAMESELSLLEREFPANGNVRCVLSGVGKVNAAVSAQKLVSSGIDCLLSIGVAGTFSPQLREGDAVIVSRAAYHDVWCGSGNAPGQVQGLPRFFESDPELLRRACSALPDAKVGLLCTGDQFYVGEQEDERQRRMYPDALAIDMEGAAVAQTAYLNGIPFLAVKIISDNHVAGPQGERYEHFWRHLAEKSFDSARRIIDNIL